MTTWNLDAAHSEIEFKVRHMMIANVKGKFSDFKVDLRSEDDSFSSAQLSAEIAVNSVDTKNAQRDEHLRSADFFDAEAFPAMKFEATSMQKVSDEHYTIVGNLTIKDITKSVSINAEFGGIAKDPWGNIKAGFTFETAINRKDFGLTWNAALETGGVMVSEEVKIFGDVQFSKA